jgi:DNA-binding CsgD family transcriptional regulator
MLKERCPACQRCYLGPACACRTGARPRRLACACGRPAVEVWVDDLGEWPLCSRCLAKVQASQANLSESAPSGGAVPQPEAAPTDAGPSQGGLPAPSPDEMRALLTPREFEVAKLAHLTNRQIADRLGVSIGTVKSQMISLRHKLGLHTRVEVAQLFSAQGERGESEETPPLTFSLTIKGPMERLHEVINRLVRGR